MSHSGLLWCNQNPWERLYTHIFYWAKQSTGYGGQHNLRLATSRTPEKMLSVSVVVSTALIKELKTI